MYHVNTERRGGEDCLEVELEGERGVGGENEREMREIVWEGERG